MPGELSTFGGNSALDATTGRATQTARTSYLALLTAAPADTTTAATMTEVSSAGYSRQTVAWTAPSGDPSSSNNSAQLTFGPFTAVSPPTVSYAALVFVASGSATTDLTWYWTLDVAKTPAQNESITVPAGSLVANID